MLGDEHSDTLLSLIMLGGVQELLGNQDEAREIFERCLTSAEWISPESDREGKFVLALCLEKFGMTELHHGHLEEAETHLRRALGCYNDLSGYDRSYDCVSALKEVLLKRGKSAEAEGLCRQAVERCTEAYGNDHSHTIIMTRDLVEALRHQGAFDEGIKIAECILAISQRRFGVDDRLSLGIMWEVSQLLRTQHQYQGAADLLEQVHRMSGDRYGKESVVTLGYAHSYARVLKQIGKVDEALEVMGACATSTQRKLGADHRDTIRRNQLVAKLEDARQRQDVRFLHEIRLERHARRKEKLKCIVQ
jgi:tetratricopeptide (TPR) repeat protein